MAYGIKLKVWGDYASFNRPEMKVERVTYDVITPSAARGILEAIYWKPEMSWVVDTLHVLSPILFTPIRRNEVKSKITTRGIREAMSGQGESLGMNVAEERAQRAAILLKDVCYGIEAHVEVRSHNGPENKPEAKHLEQFKRRAKRGQYFHHPYLGTREFPANFEWTEAFPECPADLKGERDLGFMLHDISFIPDPKGDIIESNGGTRCRAEPRFFRAVMNDGIIRVPPIQSEEVMS